MVDNIDSSIKIVFNELDNTNQINQLPTVIKTFIDNMMKMYHYDNFLIHHILNQNTTLDFDHSDELYRFLNNNNGRQSDKFTEN